MLWLAGLVAATTGCASVGGGGGDRDALARDAQREGCIVADALTVTVGNVLWVPYKVVAGTAAGCYEGVSEYKPTSTWAAILSPLTIPAFIVFEVVFEPFNMLTSEPIVLGSWNDLVENADMPFKASKVYYR